VRSLVTCGRVETGQAFGGVQRQYTGTAGKITNCQIGVSLGVATRTEGQQFGIS
jgi:SRSO17 transposase